MRSGRERRGGPRVELLERRRLLAAGELDPTFGQNGMVTSNIGGPDDQAKSVAVQSDGKIVVVGSTGTDSATDAFIARYNVDGSLDQEFGTGGVARIDLGQSEAADTVLLLPTGTIMVGGGAGLSGFLALYNSNGALDQAFGGGDGIVQAPGPVKAALALPGGKVLAAGNTGSWPNSDGFVSRYNGDGSLDTTYGGDGSLSIRANTALLHFEAADMDRQSDGKVILTGTGWLAESFESDGVVVRLTADGAIDTTFGTDGVADLDVGAVDGGEGSVILPDGRIIVLVSEDSECGHLVRLSPDGSYDPTFNNDPASGVGRPWGIRYKLTRLSTDYARDISLDATGRIVVAHSSTEDWAQWAQVFAIGRFNADGTFDTSFSFDGRSIVAAGDAYSPVGTASALAITPEGKVVVAGQSGMDIGLVRLDAARPISTGGTVTVLPGGIAKITGTDGPDDIGVVVPVDEPFIPIFNVNGQVTRFDPETVHTVVIEALGGDDYVSLEVSRYANDLDSSITGGAGNDTLIGSLGNDTIDGGDGNDVIRAGGGSDSAVDSLSGGSGSDLITEAIPGRLEDYGPDRMRGGPGNDTLIGGPDNDSLFGDDGNDVLYGADGNDVIYASDGEIDTVDGGDGDDTASVDNGVVHDVVTSIEASPPVSARITWRGTLLLENTSASRITISSGDGQIVLNVDGETYPFPSAQVRRLRVELGGSGQFVSNGTALSSTMIGHGNSTLIGGWGADSIIGGDGNDRLEGGGGRDYVEGGLGEDRIYGGSGDDTLIGGPGVDRFFGGGGNDWMYGGSSNDKLYGEGGNDLICGQGGNDLCDGGSGNDWLYGGVGDDVLMGWGGSDLLVAQGGRDLLSGGSGLDRAARDKDDVLAGIEQYM